MALCSEGTAASTCMSQCPSQCHWRGHRHDHGQGDYIQCMALYHLVLRPGTDTHWCGRYVLHLLLVLRRTTCIDRRLIINLHDAGGLSGNRMHGHLCPQVAHTPFTQAFSRQRPFRRLAVVFTYGGLVIFSGVIAFQTRPVRAIDVKMVIARQLCMARTVLRSRVDAVAPRWQRYSNVSQRDKRLASDDDRLSSKFTLVCTMIVRAVNRMDDQRQHG